METNIQGLSRVFKKYLEEEEPVLLIRTPSTGEDFQIGKKNFNEADIEGYPGLLFDDCKTRLKSLSYDEKIGHLVISVSFTRGVDEVAGTAIPIELASAVFKIPLDIDVAIAIIKDWTNKVNRVRTVLEAIKKD